MTDRKNGPNTDERNPDGTFKSGNSGKPKGARHKTTKAVEALLSGQAEAVTQAAIDRALEGDVAAARLVLERVSPARKDTTVQFALPLMSSSGDAAQGAASVIAAVSEGNLSPGEGAQIMSLIESFRKTLEFTEIEQRIAALEAKK